ncbi:ATP-binding protein [Micromonosporaceae bacterium Da 78-11]
MTVKSRVATGFAVLLVLFVALVTLQFAIGDRMQTQHQQRAARLAQALRANQAVLQYMTDAETGVRGFQLTGHQLFLEPYDSGRVGAVVALDELAASSDDAELLRLLAVERAAAAAWLYAYAIPLVNAGTADTGVARAAQGKDLFDRIRTSNADVAAALDTRQQTAVATDRRAAALEQMCFILLAMAFLATGLGLAGRHQRNLLEPLEHIRQTLKRLAAGDRSARAVPTGGDEMRAVIGTLNELAADTERLLAAEQARTMRAELRQAVAAELQSTDDPVEVARRVGTLVGQALHARSVHARVTLRGATMSVSWPDDASPLPAQLLQAIQAVEPGTMLFPSDQPGAVAVALSGDEDGPPGLVHVFRPDAPVWTEDERRLLAETAAEIDHALHRRRLRMRQNGLITELRLLDEQKDTFVSTVTHELRTPLTSILGYGEMLAEGDSGELSPMQQRGVEAIMRNAQRLQATVADLLLLDRANARAGAHPGPLDLAGLTAGLHEELAPSMRAKDLAGTFEADQVWVHGDVAQLRSALRNLLENAVKFTPAGGRVDCRVTVDDERAVVTVSDSGIGIPAHDLPGLFTPFHRASNAMDQAVQGTGLGLAIVRNIAAEHGGSVTVHSEPGLGSTFTLTLPIIRSRRPVTV